VEKVRFNPCEKGVTCVENGDDKKVLLFNMHGAIVAENGATLALQKLLKWRKNGKLLMLVSKHNFERGHT